MLTEDEKVAAIARFGFDRPGNDDTFLGFPDMPFPIGGSTSGDYRRALEAWAKEWDRAADLMARGLLGWNSRSAATEPSTSPEGV